MSKRNCYQRPFSKKGTDVLVERVELLFISLIVAKNVMNNRPDISRYLINS